MNKARIREILNQYGFKTYSGGDLKEYRYSVVEAIIEEVLKEEREECAKLAEGIICDVHIPTGTAITGGRVAKAIRAKA